MGAPLGKWGAVALFKQVSLFWMPCFLMPHCFRISWTPTSSLPEDTITSYCPAHPTMTSSSSPRSCLTLSVWSLLFSSMVPPSSLIFLLPLCVCLPALSLSIKSLTNLGHKQEPAFFQSLVVSFFFYLFSLSHSSISVFHSSLSLSTQDGSLISC